jgi:hypothetical protein
VAREILGYLRSLAKRLPDEETDEWFRIIAAVYPDKAALKRACDNLLSHSSPIQRLLHKLAMRLPSAKSRNNKYEIARRLASAIPS